MPLFKKRVKPINLNSLDELNPMLASGKPVLLDFFQHGCRPCKIMDGIVNELAEEYGDTAHVVKVNVASVAGAAQAFRVRSTPTFVLLAPAPAKAKKKKGKAAGAAAADGATPITARWRGGGLVKKDFLSRVLESNGAVRVDA